MTSQEKEKREREYAGATWEDKLDRLCTGTNGNITWAFENKEIKKFISHLLKQQREEDRQFILNVLDGIDIADRQMDNKGGGTKAIRFALKSRI